MSAEIDDRLRTISARLYSDREVLRRKTQALIRRFNNGSTSVTRWGFTVDVFGELETMLRKLSDDDCREALRILRE